MREFRPAIRRIQDGSVEPVVFLKGNDYYLQSFFIDRLAEQVFPDKPVEKTILLPEEMSKREILDHLTKTDLFSQEKIFVLRNPQALRDSYLREFLEYCRQPLPQRYLVVVVDDFYDRSAAVRKLTEIVEPVSVRTPFTGELRKWSRYFFKTQGITPSPQVIEMVLEIAGDSVYHLANEIEKICLNLDKDQDLTPEKVREFAGWQREYQMWEFLHTVGRRNLEAAVVQGWSLLSHGTAMLTLIYRLAALFRELLFLKISPGTSGKQNGYIPLSDGIRRQLPQFAKAYSRKELEQALKALHHADRYIKTTSTPDESLLIQFLFGTLSTHGG
ncbi:MAG: DNA polymerase III subunit delta [Fidelibacterota bacterium]